VPLQLTFRVRGVTLDRSPGQVTWTGHQSVAGQHRDTQPCTHTLTPRDNLDRPVNLTVMFLGCGRKPEYPEKTHHAQGEHGDSMQKDPSRESNPEPSCCKATALPTAPLCSPIYDILDVIMISPNHIFRYLS